MSLQIGHCLVWLGKPRQKKWEFRVSNLLEERGFEVVRFPYPYYPKPHHPSLDLVFATHHMAAPLAYHIAEREKAKLVCQVLDVPRFRWSGEPWSSNLKRYVGITRAKYRREWKEIGEALKRAELVISISKKTSEDVEECFGVKSEVNYLGVDRDIADGYINEFKGERLNQFCSLSLLYDHKRVELLARIFSNLNKRLVVMGEGYMRPEIEPWGTQLTGGVTERQKFRVLSRSLALVHASVSEGFFIPAAEALYCKTPVIAYRLPVLEEVYGNAIEFWEDEAELVDKIEKVEEEKPEGSRKYVIEKGLTLQDYVDRLIRILENI